MHRALQVAEILGMILRHLDRNSLASVARTSRTVFWPAVSELWIAANGLTMKSLASVLLSPPDAAAKEGDPVAARLNRFHLYASLVQRAYMKLAHIPGEDNEEDFEEEGDPVSALHHDIRSIALLTRQPVIFPRLRFLEFKAAKPAHMQDVMVVLSPHMEDLAIETFHNQMEYKWSAEDKWTATVGYALDVLPSQSPRLRRLSLKIKCGLESTHLKAMIRLLDGLPELTSFQSDIIALQPPMMAVLARHPSLTNIAVGYFTSKDTFNNYAFDYSDLDRDSFAALQSLHLHGREEVMRDLSRMLPASLKELSITLTQSMRFEEKRLLQIATNIQDRSRGLQKLKIHLKHVAFQDETPISLQWLNVVFRCALMECFEFVYLSGLPFDLGDKTVTDLARAWPLLKHLKIGWFERTKDTGGSLAVESALTLAGIPAIAEHCPAICDISFTELSMAFVPPAPLLISGQESVQLSLSDALSITHPPLVAAFFSLLWPTFRFGGRIRDPSRMDEKFAEVVQLHDSMRCLRIMERHKGSAADLAKHLPAKYRTAIRCDV